MIDRSKLLAFHLLIFPFSVQFVVPYKILLGYLYCSKAADGFVTCICDSCSIRSIVCLNLPSFSGGLNPWGMPGTRRAADVGSCFLISVNRSCMNCNPRELVHKFVVEMCRGSLLHLLLMMDSLKLLASVTPGMGWSCWPLMDMVLALRRCELLLLPLPCPSNISETQTENRM